MKAAIYSEYGNSDVLHVKDVFKPIPKPNEVLIRVYASTVTSADIMMRKGKPTIGRLYLGLSRPKRTILGFEFAGEIVELGNAVSQFTIGDRVFGGTTTLGCYAEYVCVSVEDVVTTMPNNISFQEAAPVSGSGITVLNFLQGKAKITKNQSVLINGASGGVGTYAVQIAKYFGAKVTGVCSTSKIDLVRSLGADDVIDYTKDDFTQNGQKYDIIFDTVSKRSYSEFKSSLTDNGIYLPTVLTFTTFCQMIWTRMFGNKRVKSSSTGLLPTKERLRYFVELKELLQTGKIRTVIGDEYPLERITEAHAYVEEGHKKGNVIITI